MTNAEGLVEKLCQCGRQFTIQKNVPYFGSLSPARHVTIIDGKVIVKDYCSTTCLKANSITQETPKPDSNLSEKSG